MPVKTVPSVIIGSGSNKSIVNNIYNNDFGNTIITGYLTVDFYLTVDGNLTVGGNFDLTGSFELSGDITVKNPSDVTVFSVDSATGDTLTKGDITVKDSSNVTKFSVDSATGDTLTKGDITVKNSLDVTKFSVDSATGNTTIEGDLTVNGTTTTIDSVTLVVEDPVITLAKNANSNPTSSTDAGLFLQRGSTENPAIIIWNETLDQFEVATVTGASSTTTNFTGGGVTKTFATFKSGNIYGNDMFGSSIDIVGLGAFGNISTPAITIWDHNYDRNGITLSEYGNLNIHSVQDYSSIILNHNVTSGIPSANAVIEVKRGSSTSSKITWDETNDAWDINNNLYSQKIKVRTDETSGSSSRVYIYFYHGVGMLSEVVYFYIYKTTDSGVTRKVIPINIVTSSRIEAYTTNGYDAIKFNSNTAYSSHANADAFFDMEDGASYYINVYSPNSSSVYAPTVSFLFRYDSNAGNSGYTYTTVANADFIATGGYNGLIQVNNATPLVSQAFSAGTNISNSIDNLPSLSLEYSKGIASLVLNAGITNTPADASILVDRGLSSPATLLWDESNDRWDFNFGLYLNTDSQLKIEKPSLATTPAILLNADRTGASQEADVVAIEVERGTLTNAKITWNETYDYWWLSPAVSTDLIDTTDLRAGYSTFNYLGEYQNEDPIIVVKNPSLDTTFSVNGGGDVFANGLYLNSQLRIEKPSNTATTPAILLNADCSGLGQESNVFALNIVRGTQSMAYIKWDESNDRWDFNFGLYLNTNSQLKIEKPSNTATTPAILLNADRTGDSQEADVVAIEVERGTSTNSYIKWDESNDRWDFNFGLYLNTDSQLKIEKPSTPSTTPAILLNADRTGNGEEADVVAIEVERGILSNAKIKWDEGTDRWDFNSNVFLSSDVVLNNSNLNSTTIFGTATFEHNVNLGNGSSKSIAINGTATFNSKLILGISNLTISEAGVVTVTNAYHKIDTYNNQGSSDLFTINGGDDGMILVIQSAIQGHTVVVRDTPTGNIRLSTADFHLNNVQDTLTLIFNGDFWCELCRSDNAT